jgi:hypothetical protein
MNDDRQIAISPDEGLGLPTRGMAPGLAVLFNTNLYKRCRQIAMDMSEAEGFMPTHLIRKPEACLAVVTRSITWRLDPWAVAASTYQTPGGKIGYEGKLVQAIIEQSGRLEGHVMFQLVGDWKKLEGRFVEKTSPKGNKFHAAAWDAKDEEGLGVTVSCQIIGEASPREETYWLRTFWPRNSTLWALRPSQQIKYAAVRAFGNTVVPTLLMGVPFDDDTMKDVTPMRPERAQFKAEWGSKESATDLPEDAVEGVKAAAAAEAHSEPVQAESAGEAPQEPETQESGPMPEFSAADAYQIGREDRDRGRALKSPPVEWRDESVPEHAAWIEARHEGWVDRDKELANEAKRK